MSVDTSALPLHLSMQDRLDGNSVSSALGGQPHAEWMRGAQNQELILAAAAPILVDGRSRGAVVLEQNGDQLLGLRDRALSRLFNLTLLATAAAVVIMLGFATWLSLRIDRLRAAADSAVGSDGRIRLSMPESASTDEIGALSRGFESLLVRLNEHTQYLRTLGGKLSHELRTPLTIVRSSLDNLESEELSGDQRRYITRAREGTQRLQSILSALGAAARVEESIKQAEWVNFDLRELLSSAIAAYRDGFPQARFALEVPPDACFVRGAPDLIMQLLDKLVENAVDFCPPTGTITVRLDRLQDRYALAVINDGPPIPPLGPGKAVRITVRTAPGTRRQAALRSGSVHRAAHCGVSRRQHACRQPGGRQRRGVHRDPALRLDATATASRAANPRAWHIFASVQPLMRQQPLLALQPAAISRERAVGADHPVTGHQDGNGIPPIREPHGARGAGLADPPGQLSVAPSLAVRNFRELPPDTLLKFRALQAQRQIERPPPPRKIFLELPPRDGQRCGSGILDPSIHGLRLAARLHVKPRETPPIRGEQQSPDRAVEIAERAHGLTPNDCHK